MLTLDEIREADPGAQRRSLSLADAELRSDTAGDGLLTFRGYASVFDVEYPIVDNLGTYTEVVRKGAFKRSLDNGADVSFLINHTGMTLARTKSGTMSLAEDAHGLLVEARLDPANPDVQSLRSAMGRGDIDEMSFSFGTTKDGQVWSERDADPFGNSYFRQVTAARINKADVSAVNYGANAATAGASIRGAQLMEYVRNASAEDRRAIAEDLAGVFDAEPVSDEQRAAVELAVAQPGVMFHLAAARAADADVARLLRRYCK